ncbi:hypothetical protein ACJMK2_018268 [Sinanodonta woodiana]|uniref:Uncharacterized protein n=1 Tax=Sinanodonta woodiana TaxID=1069815 RepID=A0ABD3UGT9_SINWO
MTKVLWSTSHLKQASQLRNGSVIVIFIIVIEVKQNQDLPSENELKAIITEQPVDAGDQNFVSISNFRIQKTSVTVESADESQNNPLSTKRTTSTTTSTSTSTTTSTATSTTSTNTKQVTASTSSSTTVTTPTKASTSSATASLSTTSTTSSSTSAATASTTSSTPPTIVNPSTSITSTSISTTVPTTSTTTSAPMTPSTTSITSTSTSSTIPTTTTTSSTSMTLSTTSITSTSTATTMPTTTTTISTPMTPSTTSITSTSTSTTMPTTTTTISTPMTPSTTSMTSTSTSTTIPTTTTTISATMKPSTTSITSTSTSTTIQTTTSTPMTPSTTSITSTSTSTTIPTQTTITSIPMTPSTTSITSTSTSTTMPTTTTTISTPTTPSTTSITSTLTPTTMPSTTTTTSTTMKPSTSSITSNSTSTTIPTATTTTSPTMKPSTTSITSTSVFTTITTTISITSTTANPCSICTTPASTYTTTMNPSNTSTTFTSASSTTPTTAFTTSITAKQSTANTTSPTIYPETTSAASSTNSKLITNITTYTSTTTSPTITEPSTTRSLIATSTSTIISTVTSTANQPTTKSSTAGVNSTSTTITLTGTASNKYPPTTNASTISNETTAATPTVDKTMSISETMTTTTQQPTTIPNLNAKTEIYFESNLYSGFIGSFVRLTCQATGMSLAHLQTITMRRSSTSSGTEFVASMSVNGTKSSDFQDISISSESIINSSKAVIHLDFHKLVCDDNGTYYCIAGNYSATGDLNIYRKPERPVLAFPFGVLENEKETIGCSGEVGYPPGTLVLETNNGDGKTFVKAPFSSISNVIHGNCSAVYTTELSFNFTLGWNNTIVLCKAEKNQELNDNETSPYVDKILLIVPANICRTSNTLYVPHPYDCHKYIECGMPIYLRECPAGLCRFTRPHNATYCDWTCDTCTDYQTTEHTTVRTTREDTTTNALKTTATASGNTTIPSINTTENTSHWSTIGITTTATAYDKTNASTTITTPIPSEIYFTSTSYSGFIGSSIRLTCQVQTFVQADLKAITITRNSTSSGTEFVASMSVNGTKSSDFQDISISSENVMNSSKVTIHVDFNKLACTDEGTYYCMIGDVFATGSLNILKKPEKPVLTFPQGVLENSQQDMFKCTGEVGHPPGSIVFETNKDDVNTFTRAPFTPATNVIHGNCSATYTATFSYKFTMDWNNTIIRCRADNSKALGDNETSPYVDKTLLVIQANICRTSNTLYVPHPYDCHKYIECGMPIYLRECPAGLCRFTQPHNATYCERTCDACTAYQISESTAVRMKPEETTTSTFQTTITTSGNKTISISNRIENQTSTSTRALTTTENVSDKTVSSTSVTTSIYTEIYFTSTSYSGYIGSSIRLTCQVQQISSAALQRITITRNSTSSGAEFVASISVNGTKSSDFQDISISSENVMNSSKVTIHVDFHRLACADEGTYYCMIGDVFATGSLNILKKPEKPILTFPQGVLENSQQDVFNCTGEVGHPPGSIVFEIKMTSTPLSEPHSHQPQM